MEKDTKNPYNICTWIDSTVCNDCDLGSQLNYRYDKKFAKFFAWNQIPSIVLALFGITFVCLIIQNWWVLLIFVLTAFAFWGTGIETLVFCRHCPFYAENSKKLHCLALDGWPKLFKYNPKPMNKLEKGILLLFFVFLIIIPTFSEFYGLWYLYTHFAEFGIYVLVGMIGITIATILSILQIGYILVSQYCTKCINFSCLLNRTPKDVVEKYLQKNPVIKNAWS